MKAKLKFRRFLLTTSLFIVLMAQGCGDLHNSATVIEVTDEINFIAKHEDAVILDVRRPTEFEKSHITGSVNVPVQDDSFEDMVAKLDPDKLYVVHCSDNHYVGQSNRALKTMQDMGFRHLYSLRGGFSAWKDAKMPLTEWSN